MYFHTNCEIVCSSSVINTIDSLIGIALNNGTPLQYSCLESPMDGGAWWAVVHGIAELDMTERLHFHFSLSCIGEGNCNPLQCSCLENPSEGGAWWAAIYGVAQSQTRLKQLSSSSTYSCHLFLIFSASVRFIPFLSFIVSIFA